MSLSTLSRVTATLLLIFFCFTTKAANPVTRFDHLVLKDGLSQSAVHGITQDSKGFLWFATSDGLNRYDGYTFKVFRHDSQDPRSISSSFILTLYMDSKDRLWIGTNGGGLNRYDAQTEQFDRFTVKNSNLSNNAVSSITEDNDGNLWVGTHGGGLHRFNEPSQQFDHFKHNPNDPTSLGNNHINALYKANDGGLWIGTSGGLSHYDPTLQQFSHHRHDSTNPHSLSQNTIHALYQNKQGQLWLGTTDGLNRLDQTSFQKANGQKPHFKRFKHNPLDPKSLSVNDVRSLFEDSNGILWIGTHGGGLNRYHPKQGFVYFTHQDTDPHSLSNNAVRSIYEDKQGILWLGTFGNGIDRMDRQTQNFGHYRHQSSDPDSLSDNLVWTILKDHQQTLWVGTDNGLNRLDDSSPQPSHQSGFVSFKHQPSDPNSLSHNSVWAVKQDSRNNLWVGTMGGGLNRYNPDTGGFVRFKHQPSNPNSLSNDNVMAIFSDNRGRLWITTRGGGLNLYDTQSENFRHFRHLDSDPNSLSSDDTTTAFQDSSGTLWVGTFNDGLNQFDEQNNRFITYKNQTTEPYSISDNSVLCIFEDSKGILWICTQMGLNRFNARTKNFSHYTQQNGLANNVVYGIVEDHQAHLWLSTNRGLSRFNPITKTFRNYDVNDGLQSNEFNFGAAFKSANGEMFFGGVNGFNRFFPEHIKNNRQIPEVVLTDFLLGNESVPIKTPQQTTDRTDNAPFSLSKSIDALSQLTLDYQQNLVSFEFAALHFTNPNKNRYAWTLEGQDQNWFFADSKKRWVTYTNLSPGDYTLRIKASNSHDHWDTEGKSLKITILPPPWQAWWAYLAYLLVLLVLIYFVWDLFAQRRKKRHARQMMEQLKQVDQLKDEFLANTSHELRTPLNGIISMTEALIDGIAGKLPDQANQHLAMVVSSSRRLANLVNDILDFARLDSRQLSINPQPVDLHKVTEVILALSQHLVGDKKLTLINRIATDLPAAAADEERLQQILYNLIGNGIKFTEQGSISVSAIQQDNWLKVSVTDSGIGIAADKFDTIFKSFEQIQGGADRRYGGAGLGLAISKQLVELHGGKMRLNSCPGQGATFIFTLPVSEQQPLEDNDIDQSLARLRLIGLGEPHDQVLPASPETQDGSGFRLLLVDDDPLNRVVLRNHLAGHNYQLVEVPGGEEALKVIAEQGPFDLVLLDIMMPSITGYKVCEKIRETFALNELPVIFLTAKNQKVDVMESFSAGGNDFISKPVAKHELLARVAIHLKLLEMHRRVV